MKRISKKEFKSLVLKSARALIICEQHNLIADQFYVSRVWCDIACAALLDYPLDGVDLWQKRYNYLFDLCKTIKC